MRVARLAFHAACRGLFGLAVAVASGIPVLPSAGRAQDAAEATPLPDLVVGPARAIEEGIGFTVRNMGEAPAGAGHVTALLLDGVAVAEDVVPVRLPPGGSYTSAFDFTLSRTDGGATSDAIEGPSISVAVAADHGAGVLEADERNNLWEWTVPGDANPPDFVVAPSVSAMGPTSALITWETDEESTGEIRYDRVSRVLDRSAASFSEDGLHHSALLEGLEPASTYLFEALAWDAAGNQARSPRDSFDTAAAGGGGDPRLTFDCPETAEGLVILEAVTEDPDADRVEFRVAGKLVQIDYSEPYEFEWDTSLLESGPCEVSAVLVTRSGASSTVIETVDLEKKDLTAPTVTITSPAGDAVVSGQVQVSASLTDDKGIAAAYFKVDGQFEEFHPFAQKPKATTVTFQWDTSGWATGRHRLSVEVFDGDMKSALAICDVWLESTPVALPKLKVLKHSATRHDNRLRIEVAVQNVGLDYAREVVLSDTLEGFQAVSAQEALADYEAAFHASGRACTVAIIGHVDLAPGQTMVYAYDAVPVMIHPLPPAPFLGSPLDVWYDGKPGESFHDAYSIPIPVTSGGETIAKAHAAALASADYLLVTNPLRLQYYNSTATKDVDALLSSMAHLAVRAEGALGYLVQYGAGEAGVLRGLFAAGGAWSSKLQAGWTTDGYLLLVGETEIVPAWTRTAGYLYTTKGEDTPIVADYADYPYASTQGDELYPELAIGRIVGNNPKELRIGIETSIRVREKAPGYTFHRDQAVLFSGFNKGVGGGADDIDFKSEADGAAAVVGASNAGTSVSRLHTPDFATYGDVEARKIVIQQLFFTTAPGKGMLFMAAHGNSGGMEGIGAAHVLGKADPFGPVNPVMYAASCMTGRYADGVSFAEAFLRKEAGAYVGATKWGLGTHAPVPKIFYDRWVPGTSVGLALKRTKQGLDLGDTSYKYYVGIYHVFGDPKFGAEGATAGLLADVAGVQGAGSGTEDDPNRLEVTVPDIEVIDDGPTRRVLVPGTRDLAEPGLPALPVYRAERLYPEGVVVEDVELEERFDSVTLGDLSMDLVGPIAVNDGGADVVGESTASGPPGGPVGGGFRWNVVKTGQGDLLVVNILPIRFDPRTASVQFWRGWRFRVGLSSSDVEITSVALASSDLLLGDTIAADVAVVNRGGPQDALLSASIVDGGGDSVVEILPIRRLRGLDGPASFSVAWDSDGRPAGSYGLQVELRSPRGALLDMEVSPFRLGRASVSTERLEALPAAVWPGMPCKTLLCFANGGECEVSGQAVVKVFDGEGGQVAHLEQEVDAVAPGASGRVELALATGDLRPGTHDLLGFIIHDGTASEPVAAALNVVPIPAELRLRPRGLKLRARGQWITAFIELPRGIAIEELAIDSLRLQGAVPASGPAAVRDCDHDRIPNIMVKFDRASLIELLPCPPRKAPERVMISVTGTLVDGRPVHGECELLVRQ